MLEFSGLGKREAGMLVMRVQGRRRRSVTGRAAPALRPRRTPHTHATRNVSTPYKQVTNNTFKLKHQTFYLKSMKVI